MVISDNIKYTDKKPPDKYKCIKLPLVNIIKNVIGIYDISNLAFRANKITVKTYQLIRLWVLDNYNNDKPIKITLNTIKMAQYALLNKSAGPKPKNTELIDKFKSYKLKTEDGLHLSTILMYTATSILTAIENNIKCNFFKYVNQYVNCIFKHKNKDKLSDKEFTKNMFKELKLVKKDIINDTLNSDEKYHRWIKANKLNIIPSEYDKSYYYDIQCDPQKYLKHMIWINKELEKIDAKMFQVTPLRTNIVPKSIPIDTKILIELFCTDKNTYLSDISSHKKDIWNKYFKIKQKIKGYNFDYTIITDGFSASIRFINKDEDEKMIAKKNKMTLARQKYNGLNKEDKKIKREQSKERKQKAKELKKEEDRKKNKKTKKKKVVKAIKETYTDFLYIDEIDKSELTKRKNIYIDPGKRSIFYMMDDNENKLDYTHRRRITETKRLKYQRLINNYKKKLGILKIENKLSNFNSKTCDINKFKKYITKKNEINGKLFKVYSNRKFRKYRWYAYLNTKRSEDNMLNLIENTYGKNINLIIGDASLGKHMRGLLSTPNIALKRKLKERFNVYHVDEFRTSCLHHLTEEKCENLNYEDKKKREVLKHKLADLIKQKKENKDEIEYINNYLNGNNKIRKLHSVLTYKMKNNRLGCINRDLNACRNIKKIVKHYINTGKRPLAFDRSYELKEVINPSSEVSNRVSNEVSNDCRSCEPLGARKVHLYRPKSKSIKIENQPKSKNQLKNTKDIPKCKPLKKPTKLSTAHKKIITNKQKKLKSNVKNKKSKSNVEKV